MPGALMVLAMLAAPPGLPDGWRLLADVPVAHAEFHAGHALALDPDFLHLSGWTKAGKRAWRTRYQSKAQGVQAVLVRAGQALLVSHDITRTVDVRTGKLGPTRATPAMGTVQRPGCWLNEADGALAFNCPCSMQFAKRDGRRLGPRYDFYRICRRPFGGGPGKCGCWGEHGDLIGRAGDLMLASVEAPQPEGHRGKRSVWSQMLVAVSAKTGREIWRQPSPFTPAAFVNGLGLVADKTHFWLADSTGQLAIGDVQTGQVSPIASQIAQHDTVHVARLGSGVFHYANGSARRLTVAGKVQWHVAAPAHVALAVGALHTPISLNNATVVRLLRDTDGGELARFKAGKGTRVFRDQHDRIWAAHGGQSRCFGLDGAQCGVIAIPDGSKLLMGETIMVAAGAEHLRVWDSRTHQPLARLPGQHTVVQLEGELGARRMWIRTANRLRLIALP